MLKWRRETILDIYNLILAAFVFVSPWLLSYVRDAAIENAWITGAVGVALTLAALLLFAEWEEWALGAVALWLIVSPWVLGFAHTRAMHVDIGIGIAIAYIAALELWLLHYSPSDQSTQC